MGCSPIPYWIGVVSPGGIYLCSGLGTQLIIARILQMKPRKMAAVATIPASGLPMRLPMNTRMVNDTSGSTVAMMSR